MTRLRPARSWKGLEPNMTPMVDVVFLLIVFFILVSQITGAEKVELALPRIHEAQASAMPADRRVIINVLGRQEDGGGVWCRVGTVVIAEGEDSMMELASALSGMRRQDPGLRAIVRASRDEPVGRVQPALEACRLAGIARAHLGVQELKE